MNTASAPLSVPKVELKLRPVPVPPKALPLAPQVGSFLDHNGRIYLVTTKGRKKLPNEVLQALAMREQRRLKLPLAPSRVTYALAASVVFLAGLTAGIAF